MFAFENWHSALEMKLYLKRYIHHIGGLPDFTALRFTRYNQYESMILPMVTLPGRTTACEFQYETKVADVRVRDRGRQKAGQAASTAGAQGRGARCVDLTENDLVFITNGGCVESCTIGSQDKAAALRSRPSSRATAGICGRRSPHRTPPSAIRRSSALQPELSNWDERHHHHAGRQDPPSISRRSASATPSPATPSPAASSPSRIPAGCSAGP